MVVIKIMIYKNFLLSNKKMREGDTKILRKPLETEARGIDSL